MISSKPQAILDQYDQSKTVPGASIYPYKLFFGLKDFAWQCIFFGVCGVILFCLYYPFNGIAYFTKDQILYWPVLIIGTCICLGVFYSVIKKMIETIFFFKNVIIITSEYVIRRIGLKVDFFEISEIEKLQMSYAHGQNNYSRSEVRFVKKSDQQLIILTKDRIFGSVADIFQSLKTWVR